MLDIIHAVIYDQWVSWLWSGEVSQVITALAKRQSELGVPTDSHMESAIKELNFSMKGTEKFWIKQGGQSVIQLRADNLSDTDPLSIFWK